MTSRVFDVSFRNEARRININDMTKIGHFIEKSIAIYDLNVDDISGVYFINNDNQEIFLHDSIHTKFFDTISVLLREYPYVTLFTITTSRHLRTPHFINKFRREYKRFITNNSQPNNRVFFDRPYMNVINNYYGGQQSVPDILLNQLNQPITYYRAEMYVTNNYFNDQPDRPNEQNSHTPYKVQSEEIFLSDFVKIFLFRNPIQIFRPFFFSLRIFTAWFTTVTINTASTTFKLKHAVIIKWA